MATESVSPAYQGWPRTRRFHWSKGSDRSFPDRPQSLWVAPDQRRGHSGQCDPPPGVAQHDKSTHHMIAIGPDVTAHTHGRTVSSHGTYAPRTRNARAAHAGLLRDHALRQCRQRGDDLEHRARWILPLRGTVMQRQMRVGAQGPPRQPAWAGGQRRSDQTPADSPARESGHYAGRGRQSSPDDLRGVCSASCWSCRSRVRTRSIPGVDGRRRDDLGFTPEDVNLHLA